MMQRTIRLVFALTALTVALAGCASTAKKAGSTAARSSVQGAKTGAKATVSGAQTVGGGAAGSVTRGRGR